MDFAKLIADATKAAEAKPSYRINPAHAILVEYTPQMYDPTTKRWHFVDMIDHDSVQGYNFKDALVRLEEIQRITAMPAVRYRLIAIVEATR